MVSDIVNWYSLLISYCLNPCSNGIWSLTLLATDADKGTNRLNPCSNGIWSLTRRRNRGRLPDKGLNPCSNGIWSLTLALLCLHPWPWVLILVLMEYGLWRTHLYRTGAWVYRLNPCSNGIWSLTRITWPSNLRFSRLNPCSNGIWSLTVTKSFLIM